MALSNLIHSEATIEASADKVLAAMLSDFGSYSPSIGGGAWRTLQGEATVGTRLTNPGRPARRAHDGECVPRCW